MQNSWALDCSHSQSVATVERGVKTMQKRCAKHNQYAQLSVNLYFFNKSV